VVAAAVQGVDRRFGQTLDEPLHGEKMGMEWIRLAAGIWPGDEEGGRARGLVRREWD
jgi:hypothetical protein